MLKSETALGSSFPCSTWKEQTSWGISGKNKGSLEIVIYSENVYCQAPLHASYSNAYTIFYFEGYKTFDLWMWQCLKTVLAWF